MKVEFAGATHPGQLRDHNEDSYHIDLELGVAILADGMGGHQAGEVASRIAVDVMMERLGDHGEEAGTAGACGERLADAVVEANRRVLDTADERPDCRGMGSTLVAACFNNDRYAVVHVGDSRLYRLRDGDLEQLTEDHSLVQEMIRHGMMSREEAMMSFNKNLITRALGIENHVTAETSEGDLQSGDLFLLCSDGLSDVVDGDHLKAALADCDDLEQCAERLIDLANAGGGPDNITVVLARVS